MNLVKASSSSSSSSSVAAISVVVNWYFLIVIKFKQPKKQKKQQKHIVCVGWIKNKNENSFQVNYAYGNLHEWLTFFSV